ncbi:MAG: MoaD/ThiS family protein [Desulfobacterales bacterium]
MRVEINLYATLARYLPSADKNAGSAVDISDGATVGDILQHLNVPAEQIKLIFVDGVHGGRETILRDGSRLGVFPPVGGG